MTDPGSSQAPLRTLRAATLVMFVAVIPASFAQSVQEHVHGHAHEVMPFDVASTVHVFRMTDDGGVQKVVLRDDKPMPQQVSLIQHHLHEEAARFSQGDFSDPAHLHGPGMPGLRELKNGGRRVKVTFEPLPNGAQLRFRTQDRQLVTAIHRWFGAQLSEHGADARAE